MPQPVIGHLSRLESEGNTRTPSTKTDTHGHHVLGIETSCDDTGVAILRGDGKISSNCIHSQLRQHLRHGGIIPMVAKEYHVNNIDRVARQAFEESQLNSVARDIDAIAVTTRPGLDYSLKAHALMPLLENRSIRFPFLTLLLSGGHCLLAIAERHNKFHLLGQSLDNAPGEILDKVARRCQLRNLGDPFDKISGGAAIELLAERPNADRFKYFNDSKAIPMIQHATCNFSFGGYLGNFDRYVSVIDDLWEARDRELLLDELGHLCSSLQRAILSQVFRKLKRAMLYYRMHWRHLNPEAFQTTSDKHLGFGIRQVDGVDDEWLDIVVSGGVAANKYFMEKLKSCCDTDIEADSGVKIYAPSKSLCGDNGLMIAWNGMLKWIDHQETLSQGGSQQGRRKHDLNDSIIFESNELDKVETMATDPIGLDTTKDVATANFKLPRPTNPELRIN